MPKTKGMTSLEVAIIVAIVLVIAIAVGWYLYTTFATATQQSGITVTEATVVVPSSGSPTLVLRVVPQGAAQVQVVRVEIAGTTFTCSNTIVNKPGILTVSLSGLTVAIGQTLTGRVVLASGAAAPFTATVISGNVPSSPDFTCTTGGS